MSNYTSLPATRRKRSGRVALTTMAALGGGAMVSGCGEAAAEQVAPAPKVASAKTGEEVMLFENVFACAKETGKSHEECSAMRNDALAAAEKEAPRFEAVQDCEQEYGAGKCMQSQDETSARPHFSPFLAAFLWSRTSNARSVPAFSSPGGGYQTSNGVRLGYSGTPGKYYAAARAMQPPRSVPAVKPASPTAKTAGFGETSRGSTFFVVGHTKTSSHGSSRGSWGG